jgi:hypothetical protein
MPVLLDEDRKARREALRRKYAAEDEAARPNQFGQFLGDVGRNYLGLPEALLTMGTGLASQAGTGLGTAAGVAGDVIRGNKPDWDAAADTATENTERFTYLPKTEAGQAAAGGLGTVMQPLDTAMRGAGQVVSDVTGSPALGALTYGGLNMLDPEHLGATVGALKGSRALTRLIRETPEGAGISNAGRAGRQRGAVDVGGTGEPKKPKQKAVGNLWQNVTDPAEARAMALRGEHLKTSHAGEIVGAPEGVKTLEDVERLRAEADRQVAAGESGMDWYDRARRTAVEFSPEGNEPMQSLFARGGAAYSPQSTPPTEVGSFLTQHNAKMLTGEDVRPRTQAQADAVARAYETEGEIHPENINLGKKTGPYAEAKDPTVPEGSLFKTANDIWHGRVMGYGEDFDRGFTPQEHGYLTGENLLLAERAKARDVEAGVDRGVEWTPRSAQAATWTAKRKEQYVAEALKRAEKEGKTPDIPAIEAEAEAAAKAGIPEAVARHKAYLTQEARTGANVGHLPMENAEGALIEDYTRRAIPEREPIFDALNLYSGPTTETRGFYRNSAGEVERNPGAANALLASSDVSGAPKTRPADRAALDYAARVNAVLRGQESVGHSRFFPEGMGKQRAGDMNAVMVEHGPLTTEARAKLESAAEAAGASPINYGDQTMLVQFGDAGPVAGNTKAVIEALRKGGVEGKVARGTAETGLEESGLSAPEGSGRATKALLKRSKELGREVEGLETRTAGAVSGAAEAMNKLDAEIAKSTGKKTRADLFKLREILAGGGLPALRSYVKKFGSAGLPAVVLAMLGQQAEESPSGPPRS